MLRRCSSRASSRRVELCNHQLCAQASRLSGSRRGAHGVFACTMGKETSEGGHGAAVGAAPSARSGFGAIALVGFFFFLSSWWRPRRPPTRSLGAGLPAPSRHSRWPSFAGASSRSGSRRLRSPKSAAAACRLARTSGRSSPPVSWACSSAVGPSMPQAFPPRRYISR